MVSLNHLSVEHTGDGSLLLPEVTEATTQTPCQLSTTNPTQRQTLGTFFCQRRGESTLSLTLLIGCYSAILIPAYFPSDNQMDVSRYRYPKDLVLLNRSASLLARPCQPRWCRNHLKLLSCYTGLLDIPVFVQQDRPAHWDLSPPLGLQGSEEHLALVLNLLPQPGLPPSLMRSSCRRCVVVGNGGVLHGSYLGAHIDQYDIIIRLNNAPVTGFERDAGSRTTVVSFTQKEHRTRQMKYKKTTMVALVVFKNLDLEWLISVITKRPLSFWAKMWFWREVVDDIPLRPENIRILHPEIIHKTGQVLQQYALKDGQMVPTLGTSAVVMALQLCDQVSLAGFGYDLQHPEARLHYYETIRMDAMKAQVVHDVSAEKLFLRNLVAAGAVTDITGAL
ncbi:lactosylceramide alpha-2,3-sialyltransferase-like [Thalassophryne amazonica]|uniref:lactosylceramide alpha-2,3-sialyltransferase-like n=1 Tax=Thalassophryne amazonica TaxID=390379 RepID=UPI001471009F|nr:lactosylceramide alpha-2,3-sialyltransferase-like [Thalassophryne amazonica]